MPPLKLCGRDKAPAYSLRDYPYVQRGFIEANQNLLQHLETFFLPFTRTNNESMNVWTQFIGLLIFIAMFVCVQSTPTEELIDLVEVGLAPAPPAPSSSSSATGGLASKVDINNNLNNNNNKANQEAADLRRTQYEIALFSCIVCCISSLCCHTFQAQNKKLHGFLSVCDWGGTLIISLMTAIAIDTVDMTSVVRHHLPISSSSSSASASSSSKFNEWLGDLIIACTGQTHLQFSLALLVGVLGFLSVNHTTHAVRFALIATAIITVTLPGIVLIFVVAPVQRNIICIVSIIFAGFFFASHYPEKKFKSTFDLVLPSHSLWHVFYLTCLILVFVSFAECFFGKSPYDFEKGLRIILKAVFIDLPSGLVV